MSTDLQNSKKEEWRFAGCDGSWGRILQTAYENDWVPMGFNIEVMVNTPEVIGYKKISAKKRKKELDEPWGTLILDRDRPIYDFENFEPKYEMQKQYDYFYNDGRVITSEDCNGIADALERADKVEQVIDEDKYVFIRKPDRIKYTSFIKFCRNGPISIF